MGVTTSLFFLLLAYPEPSYKAVNICLSLASLFAVMTLIAWKSKLDLSDDSSYLRMFFIGLPVLAAVHHLSGSGGDGLVFSIASVVITSILTGYMTDRISRMGAEPRASVNPDDAARFSVLAALKLHFSISYFSITIPLALFQALFTHRFGNHHDDAYGGFSLFGDDGDDGGFFGDFGGGDGGGD